MIDYQTALSELDAEKKYLFNEETRFIGRIRNRAFRRVSELEEEVRPVYEAALGTYAGETARKEFWSFFQRTEKVYPRDPSAAGIILECHIYKASWLQPDKTAQYFSKALPLPDAPPERKLN